MSAIREWRILGAGWVAAMAGCFSSPEPGVDVSILEELLDRRHAAVMVTRSELLEKCVEPAASFHDGVDRRKVLESLFRALTIGEKTEQAKVEAWVRYCQDRIAHPTETPLLENGQAIYDPYWILRERLGQCGQTNRVVVDGLDAAGFRARVVQLKHHVCAEVWLHGGWRFLDADVLDLGQFVRNRDGELVSAEEIHRHPELLEGLRPNVERRLYAFEAGDPFLEVVDTVEEYQEQFRTAPYYYVKTANREQERNEYFGWNYYITEKGDGGDGK